jgi:predicted DNA-binding transcriptional regulator YafY
VDWALVGAIADAVATGARLTFDYADQHGRRSRRTVEPYRHLLRQQRWYLIAFDLDRDDWRLFRLDRMQAVTTSPGPHERRAFPWDSIEDWLASDFGGLGLAARSVGDVARVSPVELTTPPQDW